MKDMLQAVSLAATQSADLAESESDGRVTSCMLSSSRQMPGLFTDFTLCCQPYACCLVGCHMLFISRLLVRLRP